MRPLKLELDGFTAFRQPLSLDFSRLDLFAITGPTGAGKSSLIDAICYALYGRVPRVNTQIVQCISQGADRLQVDFEFTVRENHYRVHRETRRRGAPNVHLAYRLGDAWEPLAQGAHDVSERIEKILGLDYDGFTRSVLLPQGKFEEFLAGAPDKRREVLGSLLRLDVYDAMREKAARMSSDYRAQVLAREAMLREQYGEATPETLTARRLELEAARAEALRLEAEAAALDRLLAAAEGFDRAQAERERHGREHATLTVQLAAAREAVLQGGTGGQALATRLAAVEAELASNEYDPDILLSLTQATNVALQLDRATKQLATAAAELDRETAGATDAVKAAAVAEKRLEAASARREASAAAAEEAMRHDLAATVQRGLRKGDICPVCGGAVGDVSPIEAPDLDAARSAATEAAALEKSARELAGRRRTAAAVAETNVANVRQQVETRTAQRDGLMADLEAALPGLPDTSVGVLTGLVNAQKAAREARERLDRERAQIQETLAARARDLESARLTVVTLAAQAAQAQAAVQAAESLLAEARLEVELGLAPGEWPALGAAFDAGQDLGRAVRAHRDRAVAAHGEAQRRSGLLEGAVARIAADIEAAERLHAELKSLSADYDITADLAWALGAARFQAWLQAEALRLLAVCGSEKLRELSLGRYTLEVTSGGQDFEVVDAWNGGDKRSVRTLSGGETFLASLALALALAETLPGLAAGQRVSLDSIFLDEGFGSLDPESLRLAADALDSLRTGDRMVCVITHLPELAERLPARIVVTKSEMGSTAQIA